MGKPTVITIMENIIKELQAARERIRELETLLEDFLQARHSSYF